MVASSVPRGSVANHTQDQHSQLCLNGTSTSCHHFHTMSLCCSYCYSQLDIEAVTRSSLLATTQLSIPQHPTSV